MKSLAVLCLWLLVTGSPVRAADSNVFSHPTSGRALLNTSLAAPARTLAGAQVLTGRFTHLKHLSEVPQPLRATGEFTFVRDLGVYWHTLQPFDSTVVLTNDGIVQRDEGAETLRLSASEQPAVRVIANIFVALFTLDVAGLNANFDLYGLAQGERWIVGLRPKAAVVASVFKEATVAGSKDVEQVVLTDTHGDRTVIELRDLSYSTTAPTAQVRALFGR